LSTYIRCHCIGFWSITLISPYLVYIHRTINFLLTESLLTCRTYSVVDSFNHIRNQYFSKQMWSKSGMDCVYRTTFMYGFQVNIVRWWRWRAFIVRVVFLRCYRVANSNYAFTLHVQLTLMLSTWASRHSKRMMCTLLYHFWMTCYNWVTVGKCPRWGT
jgi:hypothetical protein